MGELYYEVTIGYNPAGTTKLADLRPQSSHILAYSGPTAGPCALAHDPHHRARPSPGAPRPPCWRRGLLSSPKDARFWLQSSHRAV